MILLSGHSLTQARPVPLESLSVTLKERDATATMNPADMDGIGVNSWFKSDSGPGEGTVWRVSNIRQNFGSRTPTVELEHAINTLRDRILFGEVKASDISGSSTCTAQQAINYILNKQSDWVLYQIDYNVSAPYKFDGDSLFDAIETVCKTLSDCWWDYDMSVYPFRLKIIQKPTGVDSELNPARNLVTLNRTIDKSGMYTRLYPIGKDDLHLTGSGYVEKNTSTYGVIERTESDNTQETAAELLAWATERLNRHAEPVVTVEAEGLELVRATGESLDRLQLGRICRIPLSEFSTTIQERIIELNYPDALFQPESVRVKMGNQSEDVVNIIAESMKSAGRGGRASSRQSKEDHAWIEDTDTHVSLCALGIIGRDASGKPNWTRLSEITVGEDGIYQGVTSLQGDMVVAQAAITVNERAITAEVTRATGAESSLSGQLTVEAGKVSMVVGTKTVQGQQVNYIKAGEITLAINEAGESEAHIDANKVYIGNDKSTTVIAGKCSLSDVTADYIAGKIATIGTLNGIAASFSGNVSTTSGIIGYQVYADGNNISNPVMDLQITGPTSNVYTLQAKKATDTSWQDIGTFSRATTLSGAWGSGADADKFIVTATPQGDTYPYAPPLRLNGTTAADNFSAEITDSSGGTTVAKKSVYGYLIPGGSGSGSYVDVNTASDGSGTSVARVSVGSVYTAGEPASGSAGARSGSTYNWSFVITKGDGTTKTLTIDCTSIYSDARNGYTLGTFTLASVTLQGSQVSCYVEASSGGYDYYRATTATYYNAGTVTKYDRGETVTRYLRSSSATMLKDDGTKRLYDVNGSLVGNYHWFHVVTSGGTNYYTAGGTAVDYKGDGGSFTVQGSQATVNVINTGTKKHLVATTRYNAGSTVTNTYYTKS